VQRLGPNLPFFQGGGWWACSLSAVRSQRPQAARNLHRIAGIEVPRSKIRGSGSVRGSPKGAGPIAEVVPPWRRSRSAAGRGAAMRRTMR